MTEGADPAAIGPFVVLRKLGEGGMGVVYAGYDVALDRKVALKLIRRQLLDHGQVRTRMFREAQAMARLSHPNVVQVYQVGEHGDEIYLAMEYVEGQTLSEWLRGEKRPWQLVLRTVIAAGRGLAAAHAANLVHRDFKPDNVLVSKDGRPCVLDFGLVHAEGGPALPLGNVDLRTSLTGLPTISRLPTQPASSANAIERSSVFDDVRLTQAGKALGTPAYMSPEQHFGDEAVGPASDQFSFAITLYEALYGARPFAGATWEEIKREVRRGVVPPPPRDSKVPGRIHRILVRGLAPAPDMRWSSLAHMLDALERDPRKTFLRAAGVIAVAGVAAAGSYAIALSQRETSMQCKSAAQELVGVWDDARAEAAELAFLATGSPFAGDTWKRVDARLDAYASSWIVGRTQACEDHASGAQSTSLYDRRTACLARRRSYLSALVEVFVAADRSVVENAVQSTAALPSVDSCADAEALLAAVAPPDDPETAALVEVRREQLARVAALEGTGQYTAGIELAREVRAAAEALHYTPLTAEAALAEGGMLLMLARPDEAEAALTHALRTAIAHGLDAVAAEAAAKRIFVLGEGLRRRAAALEGEAVAEALTERARDDGRIAALLHNNLAAVLARDGADERARNHFVRSIDLLSRRAGTPDPLIFIVQYNLAQLHDQRDRLDQAREQYVQAVKSCSELLGEKHPLLAHPLAGIAEIDYRQGHYAAARDGHDRVLSLMEAGYGADNAYLLQPLVGLAKVASATNDLAGAAEYFRRAIAIGERLDYAHEYFPEALVGLAELRVAGDLAEARALLTRAVAVHEAEGGPRNPAIAAIALRAGQLAASAGDAAAARTWFERVLSDTTGLEDQLTHHALAALELARMLPHGERERACALAREARAGLAADHPRRGEADNVHATACARRDAARAP